MTDGKTAEFELNKDFDDAAEEDEPEQSDARLGAGFGGHDQFAGPDDIGGDDQSGADVLEDVQWPMRWVGDFGCDAAIGELRLGGVRHTRGLQEETAGAECGDVGSK